MPGLGTGHVTVATAGTRVQLSTNSSPCVQVAITALTSNSGTVAVGDGNVVAATGTQRGLPLGAGDTVTVNVLDLSHVWVDATVNGEGVTYLAQT